VSGKSIDRFCGRFSPEAHISPVLSCPVALSLFGVQGRGKIFQFVSVNGIFLRYEKGGNVEIPEMAELKKTSDSGEWENVRKREDIFFLFTGKRADFWGVIRTKKKAGGAQGT
jgi:hypothetical protein